LSSTNQTTNTNTPGYLSMENKQHELGELTGIFDLKQIIGSFCHDIQKEHNDTKRKRNFETSEKTDNIAESIVGCEYYLEKH